MEVCSCLRRERQRQSKSTVFLKFVRILKFVKIREFQEFLKFIKFEFSIDGLYCIYTVNHKRCQFYFGCNFDTCNRSGRFVYRWKANEISNKVYVPFPILNIG